MGQSVTLDAMSRFVTRIVAIIRTIPRMVG